MKRNAIAAILLSAFIYAGAATAEDLPKSQPAAESGTATAEDLPKPQAAAESGSIMNSVKAFLGLDGKDEKAPTVEDETPGSGQSPMALTDNPDFNYVANLIPLHQSAVESAKSLLASSQNAVVKDVAEQISSRLLEEIETLKTFSFELQNTASKRNPEEVAAFNTETVTILQSLERDAKSVKTNHAEKDFINGLIVHHSGVLKLTEGILKVSQNDKVIALAQNQKMRAESEIRILQDLLAQL